MNVLCQLLNSVLSRGRKYGNRLLVLGYSCPLRKSRCRRRKVPRLHQAIYRTESLAFTVLNAMTQIRWFCVLPFVAKGDIRRKLNFLWPRYIIIVVFGFSKRWICGGNRFSYEFWLAYGSNWPHFISRYDIWFFKRQTKRYWIQQYLFCRWIRNRCYAVRLVECLLSQI